MEGVKQYTEKILRSIPCLEPDIEVIKLNVQIDHVHLVIIIPPRFAVAQVVSFFKTQSAILLKARFPFLHKVYINQEGLWSTGYCVSTIGLNEREILRYVQFQEKEDKGQLQITL